MKSAELNTIFAIILFLPELQALSDSAAALATATATAPPPDQKLTSAGAGGSGSGRRPNQMSCYVCSTMDYANPQENSCKTMPQQYKLAGNPLHRQPSTSYHPSSLSFAHQQPSSTSTSTTSAPSGQHDGLESGGSSMISSAPLEGATQFDPAAAALGRDQQPSSLSGGNYNYTNQASSLSTNTSSLVHILHRLPSESSIRKRSCLDDENFCSVVSVVRIEFVNDSLVQKFWAMERNCSRSCNTGCMLIGERVRLRVCSQCCRTPDCNTGSGATTASQLKMSPFNFNLLILLTSLILLKLNSQSIVC